MRDLIDREVAINALNILSEKMTPEGQIVMEQAIAVLNDIYSAERTAKVVDIFCDNCGRALIGNEFYCPGCGARLERK